MKNSKSKTTNSVLKWTDIIVKPIQMMTEPYDRGHPYRMDGESITTIFQSSSIREIRVFYQILHNRRGSKPRLQWVCVSPVIVNLIIVHTRVRGDTDWETQPLQGCQARFYYNTTPFHAQDSAYHPVIHLSDRSTQLSPAAP